MTIIRRFVTSGIAALVIALATGLAFWYVWPTPYRPIALQWALPRVMAAREHRFTGRVDVLTPSGWHPLVRTADDSLADRMTQLAPRAAATP